MGSGETIMLSVLLAGLLFASDVAGIATIGIKGAKFFNEDTGDQFFIKGVDYQQKPPDNADSDAYIDPLASGASCTRDIPYIQKLGMNVARTYTLDPTLNHDDCMSQLSAAGIYVITDLEAPGYGIPGDDPSWTTTVYDHYKSVIDVMQQYDNLIGFFVGNAVFNAANETAAAAFVKAAARDMKQYISEQGYRRIPVGYAMADPDTRTSDAAILGDTADYLNCGDQADTIDFLGILVYDWCGYGATYAKSGYDKITSALKDYSIPTFFAEYGCNLIVPRNFPEVNSIYGSMSDYLSGAIVYKYFEDTENYGLVNVSGSSVNLLGDYDNLQSRLAAIHPSSTASAAYSPSNTPANCPSEAAAWSATSALPPTPSETLCSCMYSSLGCVLNPGTTEDQYSDILGEVCGTGDICTDITSNGAAGYYGLYSACNETLQIGWAIDRYYLAHGKRASYCDFNGAAHTQSAAEPTGACKDVIAQASSSIASARSSSTGGSSSSSSGSSSGSGLSSGAKIGIGVGVGIGGLLLIACIVALIMTKRRLKSQERHYAERYSGQFGEKSPSATNTTTPHDTPVLDRDAERFKAEPQRAELRGDRYVAELPAGRQQAELGRSTTTGAAGRESRHEISAVNYGGPVPEQWYPEPVR